MNGLEKDQLARELHDRSQDIGGHPIAFESVKQSARRIQRRRRIAGGAVAAMVLAVAVPTALSITGGVNNTSRLPADQPSVTETATPRPDGPVQLTISGIPRGEDPQVPYIFYDGTTRQLVTPERTHDLAENYQMMTPFDDGWLAIGPALDERVFLDADLTVRDRTAGGGVLVLDSDGSQVAYTEIVPDTGETLLLSAPTAGLEAMSWTFAADTLVRPVGFLDDVRVVFTTDGEQPLNGIADGEGKITELDEFLTVAHASEENGLISGMISYDIDEACWGVMDPAASTKKFVWETCDYRLGSFSPDGRFVLGGTPEADGMGSPTLAILDAQTGEVVVEYEPDRDTFLAVNQTAWEDSDSVVAMVIEENRWRMVRVTTSGELEAASDERPGADMDVPYWFAEDPRD